MEGFGKLQYPYTSTKISRSTRPICFFVTKYSSHTVPFGGMGPISMKRKLRGGYGRINDGLRVLELAADNREATLGKGARYTSTGMLTSS
jgi:hypothetical protein